MKPFKRFKALIRGSSGRPIKVGRPTPIEDVIELIERFAPFESERRLVRIGPKGDGGYLLPDDLDGIAACLSPGVSTESGFDFAIAERGIDVFMADASVDGPMVSHPRFHFEKKYLGPVSEGNFVTIQEFCQSIPAVAGGLDLLMQMDIEGAEYPVLLSMDRALMSRFRIIVLELHGLDSMVHEFGFSLIKAAVEKLLADHSVVHLHPNNCCGSVISQGIEIPRVMEVTLYRKDRSTFTRSKAAVYPHVLDADNLPQNGRLVLPKVWR